MPDSDHAEMKKMLEETLTLAKQNHELLRKIHRNGVIDIILRIVWYGLLIGLPFAIYYYVLGPYFQTMGASYDQFNSGVHELPGLKQLGIIFGHKN